MMISLQLVTVGNRATMTVPDAVNDDLDDDGDCGDAADDDECCSLVLTGC